MQIIALPNKKESLNIDYHKKRLILKALNKHIKVNIAAKELGISPRNLWFQREQYNIKYSEILKIYYL
jgi:transcriptional regulator with PAS, ATPase and Fis domain